MKRLLLLLAVACVGLASCSENLFDDLDKIPVQLEELQKRFDFSEVDTEGLQVTEILEFDSDSEINPHSSVFEDVYPDLVAIIGNINNCVWLGLFDRESGKLKYQYTDFDHPISYSAYGVEYDYEAGNILGIHFENNYGAIAIQYIGEKHIRVDIITFDQSQKTYRTTIGDNFSYINIRDQILGMRWSSHTIYLRFLPIIFDISKNEILCNIKYIYEDNIVDFHSFAGENVFVSLSNPLHFWRLSFNDRNNIELSLKDYFSSNDIKITEIHCSYDTITTSGKNIQLFEPYTGDSSKAPRYSYEYKTRTDDHICVVATQTEYDGTITQKTVDVRLENDELKVEIQ